MERESNPMPMCRSGCGFYGNPAQDGLCSVCYKDSLRKKQQPPVSSTPVSVPSQQQPQQQQQTPQIQSFNPPVSPVTNTAQPTVQSLQLNDIKDCDRMSDFIDERITLSNTKNDATTIVVPLTGNNNAIEPPRRKAMKRKYPTEDSDSTASAYVAGPSNTDEQDDKDGDKDSKKKKNRCAVCRKKVGLTGFECRCAGLFCAVHRYSDKHDCTFDYREHGAQEIRRNNPVVVGEKIQKI